MIITDGSLETKYSVSQDHKEFDPNYCCPRIVCASLVGSDINESPRLSLGQGDPPLLTLKLRITRDPTFHNVILNCGFHEKHLATVSTSRRFEDVISSVGQRQLRVNRSSSHSHLQSSAQP